MFSKEYRITKKKEFDNIFKNGKTSYNQILGIKYIENGLENSRFGVLVSTKVSKQATVRNKIRRQIKHVLKEEFQGKQASIDCIVIALPPIKEKEYNEIKRSIEKNLKRLKIK
jgi:ribonuclease P protein component